MKRTLMLMIVAVTCLSVTAQQPTGIINVNPYPRTISTNGSAELEVVPDEIYVQVRLQEYQKRGQAKTSLETIRAQFLQSVQSVGIPDSLVSIASYSGNSSYYQIKKKKKDPNEMNASITYQIKFRSSKLMDELVEKLDDEATQSFSIVAVSHSKVAEFRKQLKIKAIQAAKEKAVYLAEAIGEKTGEAVTIQEPAEGGFIPVQAMSNQAYRANSLAEDAGWTSGETDFKKMKFRFEVSVVFALK